MARRSERRNSAAPTPLDNPAKEVFGKEGVNPLSAPAADARQDEFAAILETALDCIIIMDAAGCIREFNPAAEQTFGYRRVEVIGTLLADKIIPPALREAHQHGLARYLQSGVGPLLGHRVEVSALRADGREFPCELTITAIRTGDDPLFIAYLRDLTERADAEKTLRDLQANLERQVAERTAQVAIFGTLADTAADFVGIADMDFRITYINPAGRRMCGLPPAMPGEVLQISDVHPRWAYERVGRELDALVDSDAWSGEIALLHQEGHEIPVSIMGVLIRGTDRRPIFTACIMRDLRERVEIERKLHENLARERELGRVKSSFVSTVSHEFRTPLGVILSSTEILLHYLDRLDAAKREQHLHTIRNAVIQMSGLMEQVLVFSRSESGLLECRAQPLDLAGFCIRLQDELASATTLRCAIEFAAGNALDGAVGDESLLRPLLTNLLTNAVKYSPAATPVQFTVRREGGHAIFEISDRGIGIPAADLADVFTAFRRAGNVGDVPGTGLGLVIVRKCLDAHGGDIHFESVENEGTTARVTLPLFPPGQPTA